MKSNQRQQENLHRRAADAVRLEREYRMMQDVAATAAGKMTGQARISLEAYVQTAYFDRIIRHANLRLLHMSRGQYELKRRQVKEGGTQGEVGLDLDVMDHYNGSVRDVGTLSGGEGFLAASLWRWACRIQFRPALLPPFGWIPCLWTRDLVR
ncbi:MAG: hypothetical protein ACLR07_11060 [Christensenellales bacterium]